MPDLLSSISEGLSPPTFVVSGLRPLDRPRQAIAHFIDSLSHRYRLSADLSERLSEREEMANVENVSLSSNSDQPATKKRLATLTGSLSQPRLALRQQSLDAGSSAGGAQPPSTIPITDGMSESLEDALSNIMEAPDGARPSAVVTTAQSDESFSPPRKERSVIVSPSDFEKMRASVEQAEVNATKRFHEQQESLQKTEKECHDFWCRIGQQHQTVLETIVESKTRREELQKHESDVLVRQLAERNHTLQHVELVATRGHKHDE